MTKEKLEQLRELINKMIVSNNYNKDELVEKSRELDELIVQAVKESYYYNNTLEASIKRDLDKIINTIHPFAKIYNSMRIVDPIKKEVLKFIEGNFYLESKRHELDERYEICENCISIRAYNEDDIVFKLEHCKDTIYLINAIPVTIQGRKLVVELIKDVNSRLYLKDSGTDCETELLSLIEHMNQSVVKDELTGVYNRRFINERLPVDLMKACLRNEPLSIISVSLNYFKTINDIYGCIAGEQVLRQIADEIKKYVRNNRDWIARYGGEELLVSLSNTEMNTASIIAKRISGAIMKKVFIVGSKRIRLAASLAVHTFSDVKDHMLDEIINIIDKNYVKLMERAGVS